MQFFYIMQTKAEWNLHSSRNNFPPFPYRSDQRHNCQWTWSISRPAALPPLMFHCPASSPWYRRRSSRSVCQNGAFISHTPGVHQQPKMPVPKVRIWFVMSGVWLEGGEGRGNLDARWSIAKLGALINQFRCPRKESYAAKRMHMHERTRTCYSAISLGRTFLSV